MIKTVIISKNGGPEVLKLQESKIGKPSSGEVLIEHVAIGLNYIDVYHRSGLYPIKLPSGIGAEGSGIIKEVGTDVKNFQVGDRVSYAGLPLGAYSSHRIFPTKNLVKVPEHIDLEVAATLMTKGLTAYYLLHKTYPVSSGETVLFHAAAGGVGQIFCQWAKSLGCTLIGTVGSDEKIQLAKDNGCDYVINYSKENFSEKVLELTNNTGVSVVYDGVGKNTLEGSLECLKVRGMMVSFGNASGPLPDINVPKLIQPKGLFLTRPTAAQYLGTRKELDEGANLLFEKIGNGDIKVEIFNRYKLDDIVQAHTDLENRKIVGPAVITPN
ncbi:MAG: quinone oxidoreductase [Candidatus Thioglobus sp.]|nr:quinone oxidoreductase [Candidatus Thioglobus sp.]